MVRPTMHGRTGASVDYYRTVTGTGRGETHEDPRGGLVRVLRIEQLVSFVTCRSCWRKPAVQAELKELRSTGIVH
jgi:hypothetical protein